CGPSFLLCGRWQLCSLSGGAANRLRRRSALLRACHLHFSVGARFVGAGALSAHDPPTLRRLLRMTGTLGNFRCWHFSEWRETSMRSDLIPATESAQAKYSCPVRSSKSAAINEPMAHPTSEPAANRRKV